jgi:hypothetical protein
VCRPTLFRGFKKRWGRVFVKYSVISSERYVVRNYYKDYSSLTGNMCVTGHTGISV